MNAEKFIKRAAVAGVAFLAVEAGALYAATSPSGSRPDLPGIYEKKPIPTPIPTPEFFYGVDPLAESCPVEPKQLYHDTSIVLAAGDKNAITIGGVKFAYNSSKGSMDILSPDGDRRTADRYTFSVYSGSLYSDPHAREITVEIGQNHFLQTAATIADIVALPQVYDLDVSGKCLNPLIPGVESQITSNKP